MGIFLFSAHTLSQSLPPQPVPHFQHSRTSLGPSPALSAGACHREMPYLSPFYTYGNN